MRACWNVEQQVKSGLGDLHWIKAGGSFVDKAMAEAIAARITNRTGLPTRLVEVKA